MLIFHLTFSQVLIQPLNSLKHINAFQEDIHDYYHGFPNNTAFLSYVKNFHTADIGTPTHAWLNNCAYGNLGGYYYYHMTYFGLLYTTVLPNC